MNINVNAYILHCYNDTSNSGTAGQTGKISQTNLDAIPQKYLLDYNERTTLIDHHENMQEH